MMKKPLLLFAILSIIIAESYCQEVKHYIKKDLFTEIVSTESPACLADDFLNVNVFYQMGDTIPWGDAETIVSYRYLGVDNDHNLHVMRIQDKDICELVFGLNSKNTGVITLIGQRSQLIPVLIKLKVSANNNHLLVEYLGDLPLYK